MVTFYCNGKVALDMDSENRFKRCGCRYRPTVRNETVGMPSGSNMRDG